MQLSEPGGGRWSVIWVARATIGFFFPRSGRRMAGSATLASVALFVFLFGFAQCKTVKRDGTSCTSCCIHFKIWVALRPESSILVRKASVLGVWWFCLGSLCSLMRWINGVLRLEARARRGKIVAFFVWVGKMAKICFSFLQLAFFQNKKLFLVFIKFCHFKSQAGW